MSARSSSSGVVSLYCSAELSSVPGHSHGGEVTRRDFVIARRSGIVANVALPDANPVADTFDLLPDCRSVLWVPGGRQGHDQRNTLLIDTASGNRFVYRGDAAVICGDPASGALLVKSATGAFSIVGRTADGWHTAPYPVDDGTLQTARFLRLATVEGHEVIITYQDHTIILTDGRNQSRTALPQGVADRPVAVTSGDAGVAILFTRQVQTQMDLSCCVCSLTGAQWFRAIVNQPVDVVGFDFSNQQALVAEFGQGLATPVRLTALPNQP